MQAGLPFRGDDGGGRVATLRRRGGSPDGTARRVFHQNRVERDQPGEGCREFFPGNEVQLFVQQEDRLLVVGEKPGFRFGFGFRFRRRRFALADRRRR